MAVIREQRQFSVGPIGVTKASSSGEIIGQGISNLAGTVGQIMYETAAKKAQKVGTEAGLGAEREDIITIDPATGKPKAYSVPDTFGSIAADAYQNVILDRFQNDINEEIKLKAQELAAKYEDPKTFGAMLSDYVSAMAGNSEGMFEEYITNTGESYRRSTEANLTAAKIAKERAAAAESIVRSNEGALEAVYDLASVGDDSGAIAVIESRRSASQNGETSGLLRSGAANATVDELGAQFASGVLQRVLSDSSELQSASIRLYLSSQGTQGGDALRPAQKDALDQVLPYVNRNNTSQILSQYNSIKSGFDSVRIARQNADIARATAAFEEYKASVLDLQMDATFANSLSKTSVANDLSQAFESNSSDAIDISILSAGSSYRRSRDLMSDAVRRGAMTVSERKDFLRDERRAVSEGILSSIGANVTEKQKQSIASFLFSGDVNSLTGVPSLAASAAYTYRNSSLFVAEDVDFASDFMSKSVDDLRAASQQNVAQFRLTQDINDFQSRVRSGTATEEDYKSIGLQIGNGVRDGVIDDTIASNAYRGIDLARGKSILSEAGASASSLELVALSAYIASSGADDSDGTLPQYLRTAGDAALAGIDEGDVDKASSFVKGMSEDRRQIENARREAEDKLSMQVSVVSGFGGHSKEETEAVDEVLKLSGINLANPDLEYTPELMRMISATPPRSLLDSLKQGASGAPSDAFDAHFRLFSSLSNSPDENNSFVDRFGDLISAKDKQFLTHVGEISQATGRTPSVVAAELYKMRSEDRQANIKLALGDKTPSQFIEKSRAGYATVPEADSVVEYWAGQGESENQILNRLDNYVSRRYGKARAADRYVFDPLSGFNGYTRGNLSVAFPDNEERNAFIDVVEETLSSVKGEAYPNGLSLIGAGGLRADRPQKAWLTPTPNQPAGIYTVVTRDQFGNMIPVIADMPVGDPREGKTELTWIEFTREDTADYRRKVEAERAAEIERLQLEKSQRDEELRAQDERLNTWFD